MVRLKTARDIDAIARGGAMVAAALDRLVEEARPGVKPAELDALARELVAARGAKPSFLNYAPKGQAPFSAALCVSVNQAVVHGLPGCRPLRAGDVVGLDLGVEYRGLFSDGARTVGVGAVSDEANQLMKVTREALAEAIRRCRLGNTLGDIGSAVQRHAERYGLEVVRTLVGHGVGYAVHEQPAVPNYGVPGQGLKLEEGLVIAIEPMITAGAADVITDDDGWTVKTKSGCLAAHEEHTVAVTASGPRVLTKSKGQSSNAT